MLNKKGIFLLLSFLSYLIVFSHSLIAQDSLRVLIIVAHPDEAEEYAGGTAALYSKTGAAVKFASLTNGDVGHWTMTKEALAERRKAEALAAAKILGVT
jgi:N-acetylglucosamine malate deacetylase 1